MISIWMKISQKYFDTSQNFTTKAFHSSVHIVIQFWKSVQVIEQKHKSNYNRLHFLIYLLHILRSISTDFSLLQE